MGFLFKNLIVLILKKLITKYVFPKLTELAESSENKIDDILVDPEIVDNAKKMILLGVDKIKEKV